MGTQVEGWNTGKVFAKRLARREGPFIEIYMTEAEFKTFGGDAMVYVEDDLETMMPMRLRPMCRSLMVWLHWIGLLPSRWSLSLCPSFGKAFFSNG